MLDAPSLRRDVKTAALAIRLQRCASFQEKLRQLVGKCPTKKRRERGLPIAFAINSNKLEPSPLCCSAAVTPEPAQQKRAANDAALFRWIIDGAD
jgi:hypothetical protein